MGPHDILIEAFEAAIAAAQPAPAVRQNLPPMPRGRVVIVGAGKAAAPMAEAVEACWPDRASGIVITPYGHAGDHILSRVRVVEAAHPVPDAAGVTATRAVLEAVGGLTAEDLVICLISGGGSALLTAPRGITLEQKAALTDLLLKSGATIHEINTVRRHLSGVKGGRLAAAAQPARVVSLIVSDVVGDDLSVIASGPTAPDPSTYAEALMILDGYQINIPAVREHLERGHQGQVDETPKPDSPVFQRVENRLIVTSALALQAAVKILQAKGLEVRVTSDRVEGESRLAALDHARQAQSLSPKQALISGGETTVTVRGQGRGGPNLEFLLALALALQGKPQVYALAADTDGIDGSGDAAGAIIAPDTLARAVQLGLAPQAALANNDAYTFFAALGNLVTTGPTGTNVNDIRIILRLPCPNKE